MAQIVLEYDARNVVARKTLAYLFSLGTFKKVVPQNAIELSLEEVRKGKVSKHKSVKDYFKTIAK